MQEHNKSLSQIKRFKQRSKLLKDSFLLIKLKPSIQLLLMQYNKIINHPSMSINTTGTVSEVVRMIINQGKDVLQDHLIRRQKVPSFTNKSTSSNYQQIVIHGGYQTENIKKHSHFTLKKDCMPNHLAKDSLAIKSQLPIQTPKSLIKTSPVFKSSHQKFFSSRKKSNPITSHFDKFEKKKQNQDFIKLSQGESNRKVVERVRLRMENEEQSMRQSKRLMMLKQYEEKLESQAFLKSRQDRKAEKQVQLEAHLKKGDNYGFNFDHEGELMLFESANNIKRFIPPQAIFKIHSNNKQSGEFQQKQLKFERHHLSAPGGMHPLDRQSRENHRIKSARGQVFASAVMKTVNLSRISMNGSFMDVDPQHFMKRNDLFNNNHSRQTTSIPYLQPKAGTIYTEIATNQVASSKDPHSTTTTAQAKEDGSMQQHDASKRENIFDGFYQYMDRKYSKTARALLKKDPQRDHLIEGSSRPIKTAKQSVRSVISSQKRPQTTSNRGRITATNQVLVERLLQQ